MRRYLLHSRLMRAVMACVLVLAAGAAAAKDLGVRGAVWPIEEPDLLREIEKKLQAMEDTGEADRMRREAVERARKRVEAPPRVAGVAPARFLRIRRFDPTVTIEQDIRTAEGTLVAARGTRINPLERRPLTRELLFIDGARPVEVDWALAREKPSVIVLLAGRPLDLARAHGRAFFYDQGGRLAKRLGVVATPSLVAADGVFLRITEVPLEDETENAEERP